MSLDGINLTSMRSMIESFPDLLDSVSIPKYVINHAEDLIVQGFAGICLLGMGGSAIAGKLCENYLAKTASKPLLTVRDYQIPEFIDSSWVVIATSYSGNTEETLSAVKDAKTRGCRVLAITSGGELASIIDSEHTTLVPMGFQPRAALPILFSVQLKLIETLLNLEATNLLQVVKAMKEYSQSWIRCERTPLDLAKFLQGKIPLFIGSQFTEGIAYRAKCQVNENAKSAAFYSVLPEANHNEIESIAKFDAVRIQPIFIRSITETKRLSKRIEATSMIYDEEMENCIHLHMKVKSRIEEMLLLVYYLDLVSLEIAEMQGENPLSVERISRLKKILSKD
ncbi:MAG: bifunctional phosphoglucose/phosphomannose isomerase [Candidatus Thorarchaeota archaeon]